jgi:hypothetical protein
MIRRKPPATWRATVGAAAVAVVAAAVLAGCTTPISPPPPGSPDFRAAYNDGCAAGYGYAGSPFHANRGIQPEADVSLDYRAGWRAGFDKCSGSYGRIQQFVHGVFGSP